MMNLDLSHIDPDVLATCSEVDKIEYEMCQSEEKVECPLTHLFTPGLYTRTIFMPAGSLIMSMTHNTRHPFIITTGEVDVISPEGSVTYIAPYMGITQPGTKRFLHVKQDTTWTTFHVNPYNLTDPDDVAGIVLDKPANPLLNPNDERCNAWSKNTSPSLIVNAIEEEVKIEEHKIKIEMEES
jgi:hypothetical protein